MEISTFKTVATTGIAEYRDKGSLFIGLVFPFANAASIKEVLADVKKQYPKANHYCFAYRTGFNNLQFRANDDGEPSGSAGKPILGQIDSKGLTDVLVVVCRYFGGTLLGVPGLINAYKTAASLALQVTPELVKSMMVQYDVTVGYHQLNDIFTLLQKLGGESLSMSQGLFCNLLVAIPINKKDAFAFVLSGMQGIAMHEK